jgi:hypothetical protein
MPLVMVVTGSLNDSSGVGPHHYALPPVRFLFLPVRVLAHDSIGIEKT